MKVLKTSEKFSVFKNLKKNGTINIIKISNRNSNEINSELNLIKKLNDQSLFFKERIPKILNHGTFKSGFFKNKDYYKQQFINGKTLSQIIHSKKTKKKDIKNIKKILIKELILSTKSFKRFESQKKEKYPNKFLMNELEKIKNKKIYSALVKKSKIIINRKKYNNLNYYLKKILFSKKVKELYFQKNFLSKIGHWNYHGGNLIFPNKKYRNFKLIDPDSSWKINDPLFSLARFFYTFPHDTMEYDKYVIFSPNLKKLEKKEAISFKLKLLWKKNIINNYRTIFLNLYCLYFEEKKIISEFSSAEFLRLKLSLALCLLRGVNANYQQEINYQSNKSENFQNKGIFLYLITIIFLKNLNDYLKKND